MNPAKKQLCEACYERLASVSSESVRVSLPESIQKCIVRGSVVGVDVGVGIECRSIVGR